MLPPAQLFLRDLDGRSLLISFGARASVPACEVLAAAAAACRLPLPQLRLFTGSAVLSWRSEADTRLLFAAPEGLLPSCSLLLPLCGGKARVTLIPGVCSGFEKLGAAEAERVLGGTLDARLSAAWTDSATVGLVVTTFGAVATFADTFAVTVAAAVAFAVAVAETVAVFGAVVTEGVARLSAASGGSSVTGLTHVAVAVAGMGAVCVDTAGPALSCEADLAGAADVAAASAGSACVMLERVADSGGKTSPLTRSGTAATGSCVNTGAGSSWRRVLGSAAISIRTSGFCPFQRVLRVSPS
jgi:hypothetical protein